MDQPTPKRRTIARAKPRPTGWVHRTMTELLAISDRLPNGDQVDQQNPPQPPIDVSNLGQDSRSTPPTINADVVAIIAQYADYEVMLSLLAACPTSQFARGLYTHDSDFWHRRLGAQTGRGCLVAADGSGKVATDVPWTRKVQHDTLTTRSGRLVMMIDDGEDEDDPKLRNYPILLNTDLRIKAMVNIGDRYAHYTGEEGTLYLNLIALWEDGTLRTLHTKIESVGFLEEINNVVEDESQWQMAVGSDYVSVATIRQSEDLVTSSLPHMKSMVLIDDPLDGDYILALDYEGTLWYSKVPRGLGFDDELVMSRVTAPPGIGGPSSGKPGPIRYVGKAKAHYGPILGSHKERLHTIPIVTTESGDQYILRFRTTIDPTGDVSDEDDEYDDMDEPGLAFVPIYIPVGSSVGDVVNTYPQPLGESLDISTNNVIYPTTRYVVTHTHDDESPEYEDKVSEYIQYTSSDGTLYAILEPRIGNNLVGPSRGSVTSDDLAALEDATWPSMTDGWDRIRIYQTPLLPKWTLGAPPYTAVNPNLPRLGIALTRFIKDPYLNIAVTDHSGQSEDVAYVLMADGSVVMIGDVTTLRRSYGRKYSLTQAVITGKKYGLVMVDLDGDAGASIESMVYIDVSRDRFKLMYGIGV